MITYTRKEDHLTLEIHQKLLLKTESYKTKHDGTKKYTHYDTILPHVLTEYYNQKKIYYIF